MEVQDRSRSPSRRTSRVEQVVGRWLRRSRDLGSRSHSLGRDRAAGDGKTAESSGLDHRSYSFRFTIQIQQDQAFSSHGLTLSSQTPILVEDVIPGGPADGRLVPGDQLVKINNIAVDDLTPEQAAEIIRECQDSLIMTVLRTMLGPKSSFITPEKRAKLRSNPVKVHFAEEVEVNGHCQGNSLLFLPNVLKVYLENGQTKAFKFEPSTTVKDIVMTLKEKLSLSRIEHFSLVLEQQHSISKLLLLHEEERIQQVVQKKEAHDYRCLFRVCFMPRSLQSLLQQDPTVFEYLYLQAVNDVLQERFAVEMRCNTALRLAALHIQERLASCGQSPKTNLKTVTKTWGIENFVSSTLLRNMREKDLKKAISFHMKKSPSLQDPKQKGSSVNQARINYLEELGDLKSFGGKTFSATMMLQDRESTVTLLVGARYGVSQVVNHKLSILSSLTEFTCITRIELLPESEKVSLVKIYLQDIKPITLLLETSAAKDLSCLISGYCRVFVDPNLNLFAWTEEQKKHRVSAEEGYVSRCGSDSDDTSDLDMEPLITLPSVNDRPRSRKRSSSSEPDGRQRKDKERRRRSKDEREKAERLLDRKKPEEEKDVDTEKERSPQESKTEDNGNIEETEINESQEQQKREEDEVKPPDDEEQRCVSEASDSCQTDSRVLTSPSSDSLDALEEDDFLQCSSSSQTRCDFPLQLNPYSHSQVQPHLLAPPPAHSHPLLHITSLETGRGRGQCRRSGGGADTQLFDPVSTWDTVHPAGKDPGFSCSDQSSLCFADLSRLVDLLPSPPEASDDDDDDEEEDLRRRKNKLLTEMETSERRAGEVGGLTVEGGSGGSPLSVSPSSSYLTESVFNFDQSDTRCYYKLCSNITPDSARSLPHPHCQSEARDLEKLEGDEDKTVPILQPPPGFGDSSSDEEFFDARDRLTSPEDLAAGAVLRGISPEMKLDFLSLSDITVSVVDIEKETEEEMATETDVGETLFQLRRRSRKRRSFMETTYTSMVSYPGPDPESQKDTGLQKGFLSDVDAAQTLSSVSKPPSQTQNSSPTVSSLIYFEGEPAQLESKPIQSKAKSDSLSQTEARNPQTSCRTRKQEMEMEPDAMESKSVTDLVKATSPTITVVRCRVDPDGKESADRRGDGKEEEEGQGEVEDGRGEGDLQLTGHMFLPVVVEETQKKDVRDEGTAEVRHFDWRESKGTVHQNRTCSVADCDPEHVLEFSNPTSYSPPPPPPPSSPLPSLPDVSKSQSDPSVKTGDESRNKETVPVSAQDLECSTNKAQTHLQVPRGVVEDGPAGVVSSADEVSDSTNSDNVFEDEEVSVSLNCSSVESRRVGSGYSCPVSSLAAEPAGVVTSNTLYDSKSILKHTGVSNNNDDTPRNDWNTPTEAQRGLGSVRTEAAVIHVSKEPLSPTPFLFHSCSPSIMGRLSSSTLRGKIQNLPLYLSRSQESLHQTGAGNLNRSPAVDKISNGADVTRAVDDHMDAAAETVSQQSDESDSTVTGSEVDGEVVCGTAPVTKVNSPLPVPTEPHPQNHIPYSIPNTSEPITEPPPSMVKIFHRETSVIKDTPGPITQAPEANTFQATDVDSSGHKMVSHLPSAPKVVTTQNLNRAGLPFHNQLSTVSWTNNHRPLMALCRPPEQKSDSPETLSSGCRVFTICEDSWPTKTPAQLGTMLPLKSGFSCGSALTSGCESVVEGLQVPLDACGCPAVYSNCFSGGDSFDDELTVYEFSCRTSQNSAVTQTSAPVSSLLSTPPTHSPSFPRSILFSSSTSELSPLLSPLSVTSDCHLSQTHKNIISQLGQQCYPEPPIGYQELRVDVNQLLSILEHSSGDRPAGGHGGRHPRDTCPAHFTENKRILQTEARHLMSSCQKVVGVEQNPGQMLNSLADSFRTLVELAGVCLWFSGCDRCDRRNAEAVAGLADVARSFRDFCLAAERAGSKRSCQDLSTKLLAKQCTALTASVFCLTQLFRTLTAL